MGKITGRWLSSGELCDELRINRRTLYRLRVSGYFKEGHHFRPSNPLAKRPSMLWNIDRVMIRMGIPPAPDPQQQDAIEHWRAPYGTYRHA